MKHSNTGSLLATGTDRLSERLATTSEQHNPPAGRSPHMRFFVPSSVYWDGRMWQLKVVLLFPLKQQMLISY